MRKRKRSAESPGVAGVACDGRRAVQYGRPAAVASQKRQPVTIRRSRNGTGPLWESEGRKVPFEGEGQHNPARGKAPYFVHAT